MPISTSTTIHDVKSVRATSTFTVGAPLSLKLEADSGPGSEVTIFLNDEALVRRLIDAINGAAVAQEKPCPNEDAAYRAAAKHYFATGSAP